MSTGLTLDPVAVVDILDLRFQWFDHVFKKAPLPDLLRDKVNWFDQYGVYVQGTSDHLVFANMEADSMIPQGTQPLGFYVNESAPGPGDIKIYNAEAHLNYDGFRFDGAATAITMVNDKGYANRDGALVDSSSPPKYSRYSAALHVDYPL